MTTNRMAAMPLSTQGMRWMRAMHRSKQHIGLGQIGHCSKRVLGLHAIHEFNRYMPNSEV